MLKVKKIVNKVLKFDELGFKQNRFYFLNLVFVDVKMIKNINNTYRKKNKATDVLTFVNFIKNHKNEDEAYCDIFFRLKLLKMMLKQT